MSLIHGPIVEVDGTRRQRGGRLDGIDTRREGDGLPEVGGALGVAVTSTPV